MLSKKKLLNRLQSLEEFFDLAYVDGEYPQHLCEDTKMPYGFMSDLAEILKERREAKQKNTPNEPIGSNIN